MVIGKQEKEIQMPAKFSTRSSKLESKIVNPNLPRTEIGVFIAEPASGQKVRGGLVLVQEIFGVNAHIRSVAERWAEEGFVVWTPAYFDHFEPKIELSYDTNDFTRGRDLVTQLRWDQALEDTRHAAIELKKQLPPNANRVATLGFCWGGSIAWLTSTRLQNEVDAAIGYYGRATYEFRNETPKIPTLLHFGKTDASIPLEWVEEIKSLHPQLPIEIYEAGHGFNCDARKDYDEACAKKAKATTLTFLKQNGF